MSPALAYGMVFIGVIGHASSEFFAVLSGVSGPEASVWRYMLGSFGLLLIALLSPKTRDLLTPLKQDGLVLVPLSIVGVSFTYFAFHWALDFATIIQVGTVVTTIPIFVGLSNLILNKQPLSMGKIIAGLCALIGVVLLLTDGYLAQLAGDPKSLIGLGLALICAFLGSAHSVMVKPYITRYGAVRIITVSLLIGAVGLWFILGLFWSHWLNPAEILAMQPGASASLLVLGFWNTTITQLLWLGGLAAVPDITRGSYLFFLKPVITAALALLFLSQPLTWIQALAIIVICSSVFAEMYFGAKPGKTSQNKTA